MSSVLTAHGIAKLASQLATRDTSHTSDDNTFGPGQGAHFDLTLLFEHSIFSLGPAVFIIVACPLYLWYKLKHPIEVNRGRQFWSKISSGLSIFVLYIAQLPLWLRSPASSFDHSWSTSAAAISPVAAVCLTIIVGTSHQRSFRPSSLLSVYLFIVICMDGVKARSYFLRDGLSAIGALQVTITAMEFLLLLLEEWPKTAELKDKELAETCGKEAFCGFWGRTLFVWLNRLFVVGFQQTLTPDHLGEIDTKFSTRALADRFQSIWDRTDKTKARPLLRAVLKAHWWDVLSILVPRLLFSVCKLAQPFLILHALAAVPKTDLPEASKYALLLETLLIYGGLMIFRSVYTTKNAHATTLIRGTLIGAIFSKTVNMTAQDASSGAAMTHMSTDIDVVAMALFYCQDAAVCFVEIGFAMYFLYTFIGYSALLLFIPTVATTVWSSTFGPRSAAAGRVWNDKIENRVSQTTAILAQSKEIKLLGFQKVVAEYIQQLRVVEIQFSRRARWAQMVIMVMVMLSECFTPPIVLGGALFLGGLKRPLDPAQIYSTLALISIATIPLADILLAWPKINSLLACFGRIEVFFLKNDHVDGRSPQLPTRQGETTDGEKVAAEYNIVPSPETCIDILGASLAPAVGENEVLHSVDITVPTSKLTIAIGASGSGKSTFLKSLIGEGNIIRGHVYIKQTPIAYCDQKPWLFSGTIRENIEGRKRVDEAWYQQVLRGCCLEEDLKQLKSGDATNVGNNGSSLSGGQRQRVAVARALCAMAQIVILDDVFSALDHTTGMEMFRRLLGPDGLLRKSRVTVVLATHSTQFFDAADLIVYFDGNGNAIAREGQQVGELREMIMEDQEIKHEEELTPVDDGANEKPREADEGTGEINNRGSLQDYLFFFKSASIWLFGLFLAATIFESLCERAGAIYLRFWAEKQPNSRVLFVGYAILGLVPATMYFAMATVFFHNITPKYAKNLHKMLVDTMMSATLPFLTNTDHGIMINRISQDMTLVTKKLCIDFFRFPYGVTSTIADVALIASAASYTALIVPVLGAVFYVIQMVFLRTSRQLRILDLEAVSPLYAHLTEIGNGIQHIRAFNWKERYLTRAFELVDQSQTPFYLMSSIRRWLYLIMDAVNLAMAFILICIAVYFGHLTSQSNIGIGFIGVIGLAWSFNFALEMWVEVEASMGAISRLRAFMRDTPQEKDGDYAAAVSEDWPSKGCVEFETVTAAYEIGEISHTALRDVSFKVEGGQKAGFVGRTGSGKSSVIVAAMNFLGYEGSIKLDGIEVSQVPRELLRSRITAIAQENLTLPGTIRQNLMPWTLNDPTADQPSPTFVDSVLEKALIAEKVKAAGGLDQPMEKLGLSAGEKQMFSMARSILCHKHRGSKLVVMDEATSNMDLGTDGQMQGVVREAFQDSTVLMIAHRTETLEDADVMFELDNGKLKKQDDGTSDEGD